MDSKTLRPVSRQVIDALRAAGGSTTATTPQLAGQLGVSDSTLKRALRELEDAGRIVVGRAPRAGAGAATSGRRITLAEVTP